MYSKYRIMYLTGSWLVFVGQTPRTAPQKLWFKSEKEARDYVATLK